MTVRVFITYAHASDAHKHSVLTLANRLRNEGLNAIIDQFEPHPAEGWPKWMENQLEKADRIILVPSEKYRERYAQEVAPGSGGRFEGAYLTTKLMMSGVSFEKIAVALVERADAGSIPTLFWACQRYEFATENGYDGLYRWLTDQRAVIPAAIGQIRILLPVSNGDLGSEVRSKGRAGRFRLMCHAIHPLMEQNRRIFKDFGPNSGADSSDVKLRIELDVWRSKRVSTIVPNNERVRDIVIANFSEIPEDHKEVFNKLLSHIDAFEEHVRLNGTDYSDNTFPIEINKIIESNI